MGSTATTCAYCGASNVLVARDDTPMVEGPKASVPVDEAERISRLRRQTGRPLQTPASLEGLLPNGRLEPWKVEEVFAVWQATREEVRTTGAFDAAERLLFLTMVLSDHHAKTDQLRQRAMFESALVVLKLPRHRQIVRGYLSRAATREGDLEAAEGWIAPCDRASDDLDTDTAWRLSRAYLDTARGEWAAVLEVLGRAEAMPITDAAAPMAELLRANALERSGDAGAAEALLRAAMGRGAMVRASLEVIRERHREQDWCPRSYPAAEAAYTAKAAKAAGAGTGGIGGVFYWTGMAMNAVSVLTLLGLVVTGAVALVVAVVPVVVHVNRSVASTLGAVAGVTGTVAFTLAMVLPTTLPMGLIFWLLGRGLRNSAKRAERLRLHGRRGTAQVLGWSSTGVTINDVPQMSIQLRVELPDAEPYEAEATMLLPSHELAALRGATVPVRVSPDDRNQVLIETD
ncbi:MAG: hypothetical protein KC621_20810 [Myxococcales bacterium]|nr:hypothetical protein [Myxococcales bacterium]